MRGAGLEEIVEIRRKHERGNATELDVCSSVRTAQDLRDDAVVAIAPAEPKPKPQFGRSKGMLTILAEDDEHLKDFADYM